MFIICSSSNILTHIAFEYAFHGYCDGYTGTSGHWDKASRFERKYDTYDNGTYIGTINYRNFKTVEECQARCLDDTGDGFDCNYVTYCPTCKYMCITYWNTDCYGYYGRVHLDSNHVTYKRIKEKPEPTGETGLDVVFL